MTSHRINENPLGLCSIIFFNFADISKIFKSIMKVIYSDIKSETRIVRHHFTSCQLIVVKLSKFLFFKRQQNLTDLVHNFRIY